MDWKTVVIALLEDIADPAAQRAAWIDGSAKYVADPTELACELFDDTGLGERLDAGPVFTHRCDEILRQLGLAFDAVRYDQPISELAASSEWGAVVDLAQQALRCMNPGQGSG